MQRQFRHSTNSEIEMVTSRSYSENRERVIPAQRAGGHGPVYRGKNKQPRLYRGRRSTYLQSIINQELSQLDIAPDDIITDLINRHCLKQNIMTELSTIKGLALGISK